MLSMAVGMIRFLHMNACGKMFNSIQWWEHEQLDFMGKIRGCGQLAGQCNENNNIKFNLSMTHQTI